MDVEEDLDYQIKAINSTVELFRGLSRQLDGIYRPARIRKIGEGDPVRNNDIVVGLRLLSNLRQVQSSNGLFADNMLESGNNFTIEMETGTDWVNSYEDFKNKFGVAEGGTNK